MPSSSLAPPAMPRPIPVRPAGGALTFTGHALLATEVLDAVAAHGARLVCIAALPPGRGAKARLLCRRLRARFPALKILVGRWGFTGPADALTVLAHAGADGVSTTLGQALEQITAYVPVLGATPPPAQSHPVPATVRAAS